MDPAARSCTAGVLCDQLHRWRKRVLSRLHLTAICTVSYFCAELENGLGIIKPGCGCVDQSMPTHVRCCRMSLLHLSTSKPRQRRRGHRRYLDFGSSPAREVSALQPMRARHLFRAVAPQSCVVQDIEAPCWIKQDRATHSARENGISPLPANRFVRCATQRFPSDRNL